MIPWLIKRMPGKKTIQGRPRDAKPFGCLDAVAGRGGDRLAHRRRLQLAPLFSPGIDPYGPGKLPYNIGRQVMGFGKFAAAADQEIADNIL